MTGDSNSKKRILILGGGFGGLYAALRLDHTLAKDPAYEVTLVNEENFSLFTPMLHEVASADINAADIVNPFRKMFKRVTFLEAAVKAIDVPGKTVTISYGLPTRQRTLAFDQLLIALGSETKFFDDKTRTHAMQMKSLADATFLRNRMIGLLEAASVETDPADRARRLTFAVAGGGFAGVETTGALNDFLRDVMRYYPTLDPSMLRVVLVHPGKVLLPEFDESLGRYTADRLREAGVEVRLGTKVTSYDGHTVSLDQGDPIAARTLVWTAGVTPVPIIGTLPGEKLKGRLVVNNCMQSDQFPYLWVVGDAAHIPDPDTGKPYPSTAQHAMREGKVVARNIECAVRGQPLKPFKYKTLGQLAAIGHHRGAANVLGFNFSGFIAWWLWRSAYLSKLPRLEKKIEVALSWTLDLFFSKDIVQLITLRDVRRITEFGLRNLYADGDNPCNDDEAKPMSPSHQSHAEKDGDGGGNGKPPRPTLTLSLPASSAGNHAVPNGGAVAAK